MGVNVLREILVSLGFSVNPQTKAQIRLYERAIDRVGRDMVRAGHMGASAFDAMLVSVGSVAASLGWATVATAKHADAVMLAANGLYLTRKEYQEYLYMVQRHGGNERLLADSFLQVNEATSRALLGQKEMVDMFASVGVSVDQLKGKRPGELFEFMSDAIANTTDRSKAMGAMSRLLGEESARVLGPAMLQGSKGVRALREEANELGLVMTDEALAAGVKLAKNWRQLKAYASGLRYSIGVRLTDDLLGAAEATTLWLKSIRAVAVARFDSFMVFMRDVYQFARAASIAMGGWAPLIIDILSGLTALYIAGNFKKILEVSKGIKVAWTAFYWMVTAVGAALGLTFGTVLLLVGSLILSFGALLLTIDEFYVYATGGASVFGTHLDALIKRVPVLGALFRMLKAVGKDVWAAFTYGFDVFMEGLKGFAPLLWVIDDALSPIFKKFEKIYGWWIDMNNQAAARIDARTARIFTSAAVSENNAAATGRSLRGSVAGVVGRPGDTASGSATVNQTNNFTNSGASEPRVLLESAIRGTKSVVGGVR
ncbi:MAG: hypothetical protein HOP09_14670 [Hyphomicrobium sp.]|nr:hypothetical protein [Hyphomicrobium sp.]